MNPRIFQHVVSIEVRKLIAYRADFWMSFILGVLTFVVANQMLWQAVFAARGVDLIQGYTLPDMVMYVLLTGCLMRVAFGPMGGQVSQEIYTGGLNKYLVFPVSFHGFKFAGHVAYALVSMAQMFLALGLGYLFLGASPFARMSPALFATGLVASLMAGYMYFVMDALMQMTSFWAENVWSLSVLLRFLTVFLGGGMAPLAFFPEWAQDLVRYTPFPYVLAFPIRCLQGVATADEVLFSFFALGAWMAVGAGLFALVYRRGLRAYSGVGI